MLGYSALFAPGSKPVDEAVEIKRSQKMKKAYNKLLKLNCSKSRATLYWRKASVNHVCSETFKNSTNNSTQCLSVNYLFSFYEARMVFRKFYCTPITDESDISLSFLATSDAVVTDAVSRYFIRYTVSLTILVRYL